MEIPDMWSVKDKDGKEIWRKLAMGIGEAKEFAHQDNPKIPVEEMTAEIVDDEPGKGGTESAPVEGGSKPLRKPRSDKGQPREKSIVQKMHNTQSHTSKKHRIVYHLVRNDFETFESKGALDIGLGNIDPVYLADYKVIEGGSIHSVTRITSNPKFALVQPEK